MRNRQRHDGVLFHQQHGYARLVDGADGFENLLYDLGRKPHRRFIEQEAARRGVRLTLVQEVDSVAMTKVLVKRGFGSTILTYAAVAAEVASGEIDARRIDRPPLISTIAIGTTQDTMMAPLAREVFELLRDVISNLVASGTWVGAQWVETLARR